ncbi:MAG TPA: Ig-like domain-containing protein [Acidimicrobiales bacterium]
MILASAVLSSAPAAASGSLTITTTSVPSGTVAASYSTGLSATGAVGGVTWSLFSGTLPPGLTVVASGSISGTPTTAGAFNFTVEATDAASDTDTQALSITVAPGTTTVAVFSSPSTSAQNQLVTYSATVPGANGVVPTGTVTFTSTPAGSLPMGVVCAGTLNGSGQASCSSTQTPFTVSPTVDTISASYSGDSNFNPAPPTQTNPQSTSETIMQGTATSVISVTANPTTAGFGQSVSYSASVSPTTGTTAPTGIVTFTTTSAGLPVTLCTGTLTASGSTSSTSCSASTAGAGNPTTITATYDGFWNGTSGFNGSVGTGTVTITGAQTTVLASASTMSAVFGQSVTYSATVSAGAGLPTPTGSVNFTTSIGLLCSATLNVSGSGSCNSPSAPIGGDTVTASYTGSGNLGNSQTTFGLTVGTAATTITNFSATPSAVSFGTSVTYAAAVAVTAPGGGTPSGNVSFTTGTSPVVNLCSVALSNFTASCSSTLAPVGSDPVTATFTPVIDYTGATATTALTVSMANVTLSVSTNPSTAPLGSSVTYSATLSTTNSVKPTGDVDFAYFASGNSVTLCNATVTGATASCQASNAALGVVQVVGFYTGDGNYATDSATTSVTITKGVTTTTGSATPTTLDFGQSVTYSANVTANSTATGIAGTPTGMVSFSIGSTSLCQATLSSGHAQCGASNAPVGSNETVTIQYAGDSSYLSSTGSFALTVISQASTTVSASATPSTVKLGQSVTYSATVSPSAGSGTPTGTVTFSIGTTTLCPATLSSGVASCTSSNALVGANQTVTATYSGDIDFLGSSSTTTVTVTQDTTTTAIPVAPVSGPFGSSVSYAATVTPNDGGTPTGTITFTIGTTTLCHGTVSSGAASCTSDLGPVGTAETVTATYSGDANFSGSSGTNTVTILPAGTSTTLSVAPLTAVFGQSVTYSGTVSTLSPVGSPTGSVVVSTSSTTLCTAPITSGAYSCTVGGAPVGSDSIAAAYGGDADFASSPASPGSLTVTQAQTTLSLTSNSNPAPFGTQVTYAATVAVSAPGSGSPAGTVSFTSSGTSIASCSGTNAIVVTAAVARCTIAAPAPNTYDIVATFIPTDNVSFNGSTSNTLAQVISQASTTVSASATPSAVVTGGTITYSATVRRSAGSGNPTGSINFKIGTTSLCSGNLSGGVASCTSTTTPVGANETVTANYSGGDPDDAPSSGTVVVSVGPTAPSPPSGSSASASATSPSPQGSGSVQLANAQVSWEGFGALTLADLQGDPVSSAPPGGTGEYVWLAASPASQFSSVTVSICQVGSGHSVLWWDGTTWLQVADQSLSETSGCVTLTLTPSTTPGTSSLNPLELAISSRPGTEGAGGYWEVGSDGGIFSYGNAAFYGSAGGTHLNEPIVGMAPTPDGQGYWEVASDGGIFSYGDAAFYGSTGGTHLNKPIVGMAPTPDGLGYWLVASDGGIFSYGDAMFYGSTGGTNLNKPIVGMAPTPDGQGYWLVASDGGIFSYGDATFYGSTGGTQLNKPIVGMAPTPDGQGYWLVASDGGIFSYGDATFYGSTGGTQLNKPIVGMSPTPDGQGYWLVASDGGIFSYGDAAFFGSAGSEPLNAAIVTMSPG